MARYCTIPAIFGFRKWYEHRFSDLCKAHDAAYVERAGTRRDADIAFMVGMAGNGYPALAFLSYAIIRAIGWLWWHDIIECKDT